MNYENHFKGENLNSKAVFLFYKSFTNQYIGEEYAVVEQGIEYIFFSSGDANLSGRTFKPRKTRKRSLS